MEAVFKSLDKRVDRIEQILPTLATKEDLRQLATKDELHGLEERLRTHLDVVTESVRDDIQWIADGLTALSHRVSAR